MRLRTARLLAIAGLALAAGSAYATNGPKGNPAVLGSPVGGFAAYRAVTVAATSTKTDPPHNAAVAYHGPKLVLSQSYFNRSAAEPTLGVDKKGEVFSVAAAFDALPSQAPKQEPKTLVLKSDDGARTWKVAQPNLAGQNLHPVSTDPYIYVDPTYGRIFDIDLLGLNGAYVSYSDDEGATYTTVPLTSAFGVNDHQTLVTGVVPQGANLTTLDPAFPKLVYYCVNQIAVSACARSLDGGRTWSQAGTASFTVTSPETVGDPNRNDGICGSLHGHAITDQQGRLYIPRGYCARPYIAISNDAATTWTDVPVSTTINMSGQQASVAVDAAGNLYYVWFDGDRHLPYLSISRDHGQHWGPALMIAPPGVQETNFPTIDAGDRGKIAITFPGTTNPNQTDRTRAWNSYVVMSTDALDAHPLFLSNIANPPLDPVARGYCNDRCGRMYDFLDIVAAPSQQGRIYMTAVDTCTALLGCNKARVPGNADIAIQDEAGLHDYGASADMQGLVIREVSGPALRGKAPWITSDSPRHN